MFKNGHPKHLTMYKYTASGNGRRTAGHDKKSSDRHPQEKRLYLKKEMSGELADAGFRSQKIMKKINY